ncbi:M48 family metallopeptidase [Haloprofundus halophilus]|uniref:M48 family metallopeptidase n=1 Tax=Haloprofundus halophilus TaxID=2283527 RepID=UPI000E451756|nr:M48 family metalloprotease [Haloprofundus halophilus]
MRLLFRTFAAVVGLSLLAFYAVLAVLTYRFLVLLWSVRPDPATSVALVGGVVLLTAWANYRFGTSRLLASVEASRLLPERAPGLYRRLDALSERMEIATPTVYVARLAAPNAFALGGPRDGIVVVDRSLFRMLSGDEFEALLAHELAHLEGYDGLVQTFAFSALRTVVSVLAVALLPVALFLEGVARATAWLRGTPTATPLSNGGYGVGGVVTLVAVGLTLFVRAYSRRREFAADDRAVEVTGRPLSLARALERLQQATESPLSRFFGLPAPPTPGPEDETRLGRLLSTHPPLEARIERLVESAEERDAAARSIPIR